MPGLTGAGNTVTNDKLNFLNVNALSPETLYTNSIILQAKNAGLTGATRYVISIAPPALDQPVLFNKLKEAFIDCQVVSRLTSGYTGYVINWGPPLVGASNLELENLTSTSANITWIESPQAFGVSAEVYLDDNVTIFNATITNLGSGFCAVSGLSPGSTYLLVLRINMPNGLFGTAITITTLP